MVEEITVDEVFTESQIKLKIDNLLTETLFSSLTKALNLINGKFEAIHKKGEVYCASTIASISSCLLLDINNSLIESDEKNSCYRRSTDRIYNVVISCILNRLPSSYHCLFIEVYRSILFDACTLFNYDFNELTKRIDLRFFYISPDVENVKAPKYVWSGTSEGFEKLIGVVEEKGICRGDEFRKLFGDDLDNEQCIFNTTDVDSVLQFMACLKESGLVRVSGIRGFYKVLEKRVYNFKHVFLKGRSAQRRVDIVKEMVTWEGNQGRFNGALRKVILS